MRPTDVGSMCREKGENVFGSQGGEKGNPIEAKKVGRSRLVPPNESTFPTRLKHSIQVKERMGKSAKGGIKKRTKKKTTKGMGNEDRLQAICSQTKDLVRTRKKGKDRKKRLGRTPKRETPKKA